MSTQLYTGNFPCFANILQAIINAAYLDGLRDKDIGLDYKMAYRQLESSVNGIVKNCPALDKTDKTVIKREFDRKQYGDLAQGLAVALIQGGKAKTKLSPSPLTKG